MNIPTNYKETSGSYRSLEYNYFRDYDPKTGRYIQSDPIGQLAGVNTYTYVTANPVNWSDPLGLKKLTFNFYRGWGFSISVGKDNTTGEWFVQGTGGKGLGTGLTYDPNGNVPQNTDAGKLCKKAFIGFEAEAGLTAGTFSANVNYTVGNTIGYDSNGNLQNQSVETFTPYRGFGNRVGLGVAAFTGVTGYITLGGGD